MSDVPSRALRDTLRDQLERPPSGCLDAETLAAWCDGTLSRNDRAIAESHVATCARCQATLAAMAKTAPPASPRRWWQTATVRWLVPVAAVSSLAIVVWMNRPAERPELFQFEPAATSALPAASETPPARERAEPKREERSAAKTAPTTAPVEPPLALEAPAPAAVAREEAPLPAQASAQAAPRADSFRTALSETVVILPEQRTADRSAAFAFRSSNQNVQWRIVAGVTVERSTDGGSTWQTQSTGATGRLTAGAAPSQTVCWLVGMGGIVLVSKDGRTWQRVEFPEPVDLVAIVAQSDSTATVTTADGREFSTTDGGKTWR